MSERGRLYMRQSGVLAYLGRDATHVTSLAATLLDTSMKEFAPRATSDDLAQRVEITAPVIWFGTPGTVIYQITGGTIAIAPGGVMYAFGPFRNFGSVAGGEVIGASTHIAPASTTDYTMNTLADGSGSDLTSYLLPAVSVTARGVSWTLTNYAQVVGYVTLLQLRGTPIYRTPTKVVEVVPTPYGNRVVSFEMPYQSDVNYVAQVAAAEAALYARPGQPRAASVSFPAARTPALALLAGKEQGDRVAITEAVSGISLNEYVIVGQTWDVRAPRNCVVTWHLEAVAGQPWVTPTFTGAGFNGRDVGSTVIPGAWTVQAGDVITFRYLMGTSRTMTFAFHIATTSVSGAPAQLSVPFPDSRDAYMVETIPLVALDNGVRVACHGQFYPGGGVGRIGITRADGATWSNSTNNTTVSGIVTFEATTQ